MTKEEFESELREKLRLTEVTPGNWVGRTVIPEFIVTQPFVLMVRLVELSQREATNPQNQRHNAVAVAINLALRVEKNHRAVYESLLEINGEKTLGAFFISDEDQIAIGAEMPCGSDPGNYFSKEELAFMMMALLTTIKEHYTSIVQLIHAEETPVETGFLDKWKTLVGKRGK